jgi:hypothetical protein
VEATNAIRGGSGSGPPSLVKFSIEHQLWERLGQRLDPRPLYERPWREVEDYILYVQLICREEDAQRRRQQHRGH